MRILLRQYAGSIAAKPEQVQKPGFRLVKQPFERRSRPFQCITIHQPQRARKIAAAYSGAVHAGFRTTWHEPSPRRRSCIRRRRRLRRLGRFPPRGSCCFRRQEGGRVVNAARISGCHGRRRRFCRRVVGRVYLTCRVKQRRKRIAGILGAVVKRREAIRHGRKTARRCGRRKGASGLRRVLIRVDAAQDVVHVRHVRVGHSAIGKTLACAPHRDRAAFARSVRNKAARSAGVGFNRAATGIESSTRRSLRCCLAGQTARNGGEVVCDPRRLAIIERLLPHLLRY